ncbi:uncharacterized protein BDZ99DRAFT_313898 [Mytilinidion resinicola]|uniref:Zn(2)-C6 fungal-type domain-containing protein n=1 Tax=Mytilinidion resinicola TaxID=574789 RepID=A0A6A6YNN9_9PEZI|nr:uncharacterized protein BDZ99DRAFT_313898 [Mytilinidion resinicola]KAF2810506.1 hypothetical protein BDZ99DRAFT_313898 [Mytilinidion resinicola]
MVNYGVSSACGTCKRRRKKCDEHRPSCQRCIRAQRICLGYQSSSELQFRPYGNITATRPYRPALSDVYDVKMDSELEDRALATFLDDYCLASQSSDLVGSILDDFKPIIVAADSSSDLARAANITALASMGKKSSRPSLVNKARVLYTQFLESLQTRLAHGSISGTPESMLVIVLLGIFEMISATEEHASNHGTHSQGVYALLSTAGAPLFTLSWAGCFRKAFQSVLYSDDCLNQPSAHPLQSLDILFSRSSTVLRKIRTLLSAKVAIAEELHTIMRTASNLDDELANWATTRLHRWQYRTIGKFDPLMTEFKEGFFWLFGRVDVYADLYISTIWNTYRKVRLMIIDVIFSCASKLNMRNSFQPQVSTAQDLVDDIAASLCFHLCADVPDLVRNAESGAPFCVTPGKSLGGLLLMHPLFIASGLSITKVQQRRNMREALVWIADHMGIGQAQSLLKTPQEFPNETVADGYMLIWVGMLYKRELLQSV